MSEILAYLLTWTTYGTWLPGDRRGWVRRPGWSRLSYRRSNPPLQAAMARSMNDEAVALSPSHRDAVTQSVRESCDVQGWTLHALAVLSNHVHVVVTAGDVTPERVMTRLKAYGTRALNARFGRRRRWWTRHGSTRYLKTSPGLSGAIHYVKHQ